MTSNKLINVVITLIIISLLLIIVFKMFNDIGKEHGDNPQVNNTIKNVNESLEIIEENYEDIGKFEIGSSK